MKILHVTKKYPNALGGDATAVSNLEKQQIKNGNEVFILTTNCEDIIDKKNVIKFGVKDTPSGLDKITFKRIISLIQLYFKSKKILKEIKPDIVHSHSVDMGFIMSFACKKYGVPIINTCHGVTFNDLRWGFLKCQLDKFLLRKSKFNKIITVDENSLKDFEKEKIRNVIYVSNAVEILKIRKTQIKSRKIKIIFVGRLEEVKGIIYLINAVNQLKNKNLDFEIDIIGVGSLEDALKEEIRKKNLKKYFNFLGTKTQKELINLYSNSDIFVLPSTWEGFPVTILEAWNFKLPVIATNVGGVSKVCTNNKNALIIPSKNSEAIKNAMLKLIEDKNLRKKLGVNGRKLVEEKYGWEKVNRKIEEIYKKARGEK